MAAKDSFAVVVVEGGSKALKFYRKLMLKRMKWHITVEEEKARAEGEDGDDEQPAAEQEQGKPHSRIVFCHPGTEKCACKWSYLDALAAASPASDAIRGEVQMWVHLPGHLPSRGRGVHLHAWLSA